MEKVRFLLHELDSMESLYEKWAEESLKWTGVSGSSLGCQLLKRLIEEKKNEILGIMEEEKC